MTKGDHMSDKKQDGSKYQAALSLAETIYRNEQISNPTIGNNRQYWLTLYRECLAATEGSELSPQSGQ